MASFNKVIIIGNLGQDPELRYTQNQNAVATLNVATTDYRQGADGQRQEFTEWHRIVVWNKQAENCAKYLAKGRSVMIEGRLQTRSWEDKQGQKRYTTEIIAQTVQFLGGASGRDAGASREPSYGQDMGDNVGMGGVGMGGVGMGGVGMGGVGMGGNMGGPDNMGGPNTPSLDDIPF